MGTVSENFRSNDQITSLKYQDNVVLLHADLGGLRLFLDSLGYILLLKFEILLQCCVLSRSDLIPIWKEFTASHY